MDSPSPPAPALARAEFTVQGEGFSLSLQATVPAGPVHQADLLPLARAIADAVVAQTQQAVEAAGQSISCRAGCGACCRSLVAVSEVEARRLQAHISALPEARRQQLRSRFDEALAALARAGLLEGLQHWADWSEPEYRRQLTAYFAAGVACPLLEDETCGLYAERPITCREFLVTSPPRHCGELGSDQIRRVALPVRVFNAMARWQPRATDENSDDGSKVQERWVPLVLALAWAEAHPDDTPARPGPELLRELLGALNG
jgi:Fe-S-cluster containining protein